MTQDMARIGPAGMIFVPSVGGISHSPRELSRAEDITNGANVLLGRCFAWMANAEDKLGVMTYSFGGYGDSTIPPDAVLRRCVSPRR